MIVENNEGGEYGREVRGQKKSRNGDARFKNIWRYDVLLEAKIDCKSGCLCWRSTKYSAVKRRGNYFSGKGRGCTEGGEACEREA